MTKIVILGSSNALIDQNHENTHMVIMGKKRCVLVDCPSSPLLRLERVGLEINKLTDLIVTHFHPDHVSGVPKFLLEMWLTGRQDPLKIYGLDYTIDRLGKMMGLFDWENWPGFFQVSFVRLPAEEMELVLEDPEYKIFSSPVKHIIPNMGLRVEFSNQKVFAYSSDSEPCGEVVRLAAGADILVHESSGAVHGHSSAEQAGDVAALAGAAHLYLVHYPNGAYRTSDLISEARSHYQGKVSLAEDFTALEFK